MKKHQATTKQQTTKYSVNVLERHHQRQIFFKKEKKKEKSNIGIINTVNYPMCGFLFTSTEDAPLTHCHIFYTVELLVNDTLRIITSNLKLQLHLWLLKECTCNTNNNNTNTFKVTQSVLTFSFSTENSFNLYLMVDGWKRCCCLFNFDVCVWCWCQSPKTPPSPFFIYLLEDFSSAPFWVGWDCGWRKKAG